MHVSFPPQPEHNGRHQHEQAGCAESNVRSPARIQREILRELLQQVRDQQCRKHGTRVDRKIKPTECFRQQMLVGGTELVADVCRNTRLDAARAQSDQSQAKDKAVPSFIQAEHKVTKAIDNREIKDRLVLAPERIGQNRAQNRDEITHIHERVIPLVSLRIGHVIRRSRRVQHVFSHKRRQD